MQEQKGSFAALTLYHPEGNRAIEPRGPFPSTVDGVHRGSSVGWVVYTARGVPGQQRYGPSGPPRALLPRGAGTTSPPSSITLFPMVTLLAWLPVSRCPCSAPSKLGTGMDSSFLLCQLRS